MGRKRWKTSEVLTLYLAALLVAVGVFVVQLAFGHHDAAAGHDLTHDAGADHEAGAWSLLASVRFWSFALLAFGLVGSLLTLFGLAGPVVTAVIATGTGLTSGTFAATVIRRLVRQAATSHASSSDVVGRLGRVIVPPDEEGRGKVRVELKGSYVDYVARSNEPIAVEDAVVVEEYDGSEVLVSRAPKELKE